jgi:ubiquitin-conjugating enzyme E2 variant
MTLTIIQIAAQAIGLYFLLDFLTGVVHWWMDRYGKEDMPIVGKAIIEINTWHHENPRKMTTRSYWYLCKSGWAGVSLMWIVAYFATGQLTWQWWFVGILGANANIVHRWAHEFNDERPKLVTLLQRFRILQRPKDHARHHTKPETRAYCTFTPWLNPVLDRIRFWFTVEAALAIVGFKTTERIH